MSNKVKNENNRRIEAKKTHMVNHVIKICDVILGPHNVRNGSYREVRIGKNCALDLGRQITFLFFPFLSTTKQQQQNLYLDTMG